MLKQGCGGCRVRSKFKNSGTEQNSVGVTPCPCPMCATASCHARDFVKSVQTVLRCISSGLAHRAVRTAYTHNHVTPASRRIFGRKFNTHKHHSPLHFPFCRILLIGAFRTALQIRTAFAVTVMQAHNWDARAPLERAEVVTPAGDPGLICAA